MTTATKKQTAGNNALLAKVKRIFNSKVFAEATRILNAEGDDATREYLSHFHGDVTDAGLDAFIRDNFPA